MLALGDHPLPSSPIKGEVHIQFEAISRPYHETDTSPLMGEAGRGWHGALQGFQ